MLYPNCAPHVVHRILVARVVLGGALLDDVPRVGDVGQLRPVQLPEDACLDLAGQEIGAWHDDVVAGATSEQLGLEDLVGIKDVVDDLYARLPGEGVDDRRLQVVRPVVKVNDFVASARTGS